MPDADYVCASCGDFVAEVATFEYSGEKCHMVAGDNYYGPPSGLPCGPLRQVRRCEDCGDPMPFERQRIRCRHCKKLTCGWCYHHTHGLGYRYAVGVQSDREQTDG